MMTSEELLEVCVTILSAHAAKLDVVAARTRSKALEYWLQCELVASLKNRYSGACREVVSEWYIPMEIAGTSKGMGECDILLIDKDRRGPIRALYEMPTLLGGAYIEIKTSIHNDVSPLVSRSSLVKKMLADIGRIERLRVSAQESNIPAEGYLVGAFFDASPISGQQRPSCLADLARWFDEEPELRKRASRLIEFQDHHGIMACVWKR